MSGPQKAGRSIARASKDDLGTWHKYYIGGFSEAGVGGQATAIIPRGGVNGQIWHSSVSWNVYLGQYLMLHTDYNREGALFMRVSDDMLAWSNPTLVVPASSEYGYRYPTLLGMPDDVTHQGAWLYFGRTKRGERIGPDTLLGRRRFIFEELPR